MQKRNRNYREPSDVRTNCVTILSTYAKPKLTQLHWI